MEARLDKAVELGYDALRSSHLEDYRELFGRVELDLNHDPEADVPTDELLKAYRTGQYDGRALEVLLFQYGRYLLISSSRAGSLPANLQGVWNNSNTPVWSCDYHFNVNVQMCYWPAYVANLAETAQPLVEYVDSLRPSGRDSAGVFFNVKSTDTNPENGWMLTTRNNPFGLTAINSASYGWGPEMNAWISQNLWEYYEFTQDLDYLREKIYPVIREAAVFWTQALQYDAFSDRLVVTPSYSSEQGSMTAGCTYSQELVWQLYTDVIQASEVLGVDEDLRATLTKQREQLAPLHIGQNGTIKEWYNEDAPGFNKGDAQHRHISHLVGLYPGKHLTADMPEYLEAAKKVLEIRGDSGTGWSRAHKMNLWARALDGDHAYRLLSSQLERSTYNGTTYDGTGGGTYDNLFSAHPPLQMDGNSGATAGISEMLLQSHTGRIVPLAALPAAWPSGSYRGLMARGNFETDAVWEGGNLTELTLHSGSGKDCVVSYPGVDGAKVTCDGAPVTVEVTEDGDISFPTVAGKTYRISDIPAARLPFPSGLAALRQGLSEVTLSWNAVENAAGYQIYRSTDGKSFTRIAAGVTGTSYQDRTAMQQEGTSYSYRVIAVDSAGYEGRSGPGVTEQWDSEISGRLEAIALTSPTGVTALRMEREQIQLAAELTPADALVRQLSWSITKADGSPTTLATVDQNGLVSASGFAGEETLRVTAAARDGSGVKGTFELHACIPDQSENVLLGRNMTTNVKTYDVSTYGPQHLTDGWLGSHTPGNYANNGRLALVRANTADLVAELAAPAAITTVEVYERIDTSGPRIENIAIQISQDGTTWTEPENPGTVSHVPANTYVEHWTVSGIKLEEPAKWLKVTISNSGNKEMSVWEVEAYEHGQPENLFFGKVLELVRGTAWSNSFGPVFLTDGYLGQNVTNSAGTNLIYRENDRLAMSNSPELQLQADLGEAKTLTTLDIYERIDIVEGNKARIQNVSLQVSQNGTTWTDAPYASLTHATLSNDMERWIVNGIRMDQPAQYIRVTIGGHKEITLWEVEAYALENDPVRQALLDALKTAADYVRSDFTEDEQWTAFQSARTAAITAANDGSASAAAMQAAADALTAAMQGSPAEPTLERLEIVTSSKLLPVGQQLPLQVWAHYDRGQARDVTKEAQYRSGNSTVATVTAGGVVNGDDHGHLRRQGRGCRSRGGAERGRHADGVLRPRRQRDAVTQGSLCCGAEGRPDCRAREGL